jgi:hypothetical protein
MAGNGLRKEIRRRLYAFGGHQRPRRREAAQSPSGQPPLEDAAGGRRAARLVCGDGRRGLLDRGGSPPTWGSITPDPGRGWADCGMPAICRLLDVVGQSAGPAAGTYGRVVCPRIPPPLGCEGWHVGNQTAISSGAVSGPQLKHPPANLLGSSGLLLAESLGGGPLPTPPGCLPLPPLALAQKGNLLV